MTALLNELDKLSINLPKSLREEIRGYLEETGKIAYNELFYEFENTHSGISFAMLREEELKTIIDTPVAHIKLSERLNAKQGVVSNFRDNIKHDLTRLFLHGEGYPVVSARLAEWGHSSYKRVLMIARTEAGRVQAITRQKAQTEAESIGIDFEKMWVATLDKRTRHNHQLLDGVRVKPDEYFEINGHKAKQPHMFGRASEDINCRCRTISRLSDDQSELLRRDNETRAVGEWRNYREWEQTKNEALERELSGKEFGANLDYVRSDEYLNKLRRHPMTNNISETVARVARQMLQHRNGTSFEDYYLLDVETGKVVAVSNKARKVKGVVYNDQVRNAFKSSSEKGLVSIHNHPSGYPPSLSDLASLQQRSKNNSVKYGLTAGHDGSVYWYLRPNKRIPKEANRTYEAQIDKFRKMGYSEVVAQEKSLEMFSELFDFKFGRID